MKHTFFTIFLFVYAACSYGLPEDKTETSNPKKANAVEVFERPEFAPYLSNVRHSYAEKVYSVKSASQLHKTLDKLNRSGGNGTIALADGVYLLENTLKITAPNISLVSQSGNPKAVVIEGDGMAATALIGNLIWVGAADFVLDGITLRKSRYHLIQFAGEQNADSPIVRNCVLQDALEQMIKVTRSEDKVVSKGLVEFCTFEYTAGIGPQWYIGGLDAHGAKEWTIRNNLFKNIASPSRSVAEHAIHLWNGSEDNLVENNIIIDCDRGIGLGMRAKHKGVSRGGVVRNNMIFHSGNPDHKFADVGIILEESDGAEVYNNTVYMKSRYAWAIEYRWENSLNNKIFNNLSNKGIRPRNGAKAELSNNVTNARKGFFKLKEAGDLRLSTANALVVDRGKPVKDLKDIEGQHRNNVDIGADEFSASEK